MKVQEKGLLVRAILETHRVVKLVTQEKKISAGFKSQVQKRVMPAGQIDLVTGLSDHVLYFKKLAS